MQIIQLEFSSALNTSLQKGDILYYSTLTPAGSSGFEQASTGGITKLGVITNIDQANINFPKVNVIYDEINVNPPTAGDYIMFEKNKRVNSSNLVGYYAEVQFKNYSTEKAELFSIGSEVSESSK